MESAVKTCNCSDTGRRRGGNHPSKGDGAMWAAAARLEMKHSGCTRIGVVGGKKGLYTTALMVG